MGTRYDVLLVNCGLHDIRRFIDKTEIEVPLPEYAMNLSKIINVGSDMSELMIWIDTTPVIDEVHNLHSDKMQRFSSDLSAYRHAANWIMKEKNIPIIYLYDFTEPFDEEAFIDHVHFTEVVREKQAEYINGELLKITGD